MAVQITRESVTARMAQLGMKVFSGSDYDLNLVGCRMLPGAPNSFDDTFCAFWQVKGAWNFRAWSYTSDPGLYWLQHPMRVEGTFILEHDQQFRSCWKLGEHHVGTPEAYPALVQDHDEVFTGWRDRNLDGVPDYSGPLVDDVQGLNCHHAGTNSSIVDKWSAACQVFKRIADHNELMDLARKQAAAGHGSRYSFSLLKWPPV